tara:strand:- start:11 stop:682 length:672 start_codon:yes stop_codon:yes gene_type:complete
MNAVLYIRASTNKQELTPKVQAEKLQAYCNLHDHDVIDVIQDVKSSKNTNRPGLQRALQIMKGGGAGHILVVHKIDRLTRCLSDLCDLIDRCKREKWVFASTTEQIDLSTPVGICVAQILGAIAQWERARIGERTKDIMQHLKRSGRRYCGKAPYGYQWDDKLLTPNQDELATVEQITALSEQGMGPTAISNKLRELAITNREGKTWSKQSISKLLKTWEPLL